jgi:hypothetical protein
MSRNRKKWSLGAIFSATLCCFVGCASLGGGSKVELVKESKPEATILLSAKPTKAAQLGAYELQQHVKLITGAVLPIETDSAKAKGLKIYIGDNPELKKLGVDCSSLKLQEYMIKFMPGTIVIAGKDEQDFGKVNYDLNEPQKLNGLPSFWDEQGTLYGVYDFLERFCDVRWFNNTDVGIDYPQTKTLVIEAKDIKRKPFFKYRHACGLPWRWDATNILWQTKDKGFKEWEDAAYADLKKQYPNAGQFKQAKDKLNHLYLLRVRNGGEYAHCNHSLYGYYDRFWKKNPKKPEIFEKSEPKWFAQGWGDAKPEQMCYTNPELVDQVAKDADNYFNGKGIHPFGGQPCNWFWGKNFFAVVPQDNGFYCKCPKCQALLKETDGTNGRDRSSTLMFNFVNEVARKVAKTHPDKWISCLAYAGYMAPPKFKLDKNVIVQFCFDSNRAPMFTKAYQNQLKYLKEWVERRKGLPVYLWLYYTFPKEIADNGNWYCFPGFFAHSIDKQFKLYRDYDIKGMFHCGYGQDVESYVTFRLMDDPSLDVDVLLDEYFGRLFGPAGEPLKKMYLMIEEIYENPDNYPKEAYGHQSFRIAWDCLGTAERMKTMQGFMDEAKKLADTDLRKKRVELWGKAIWDYMKTGRAKFEERTSAPIPSVNVPAVSGANGDANKVDWSKAASLGDKWFDRGSKKPANRKLSGRIAHDDNYLYLELTDPCDPTKLKTSAAVFCYDDWEIFIGKQRGVPYRQYAVSPAPKIVALTHGEVNFRKNVSIDNPGIKAVSLKEKDKWVLRLAMPLKTMVAGGVKPDGTLYMNVLRVSNPNLSNVKFRYEISTWVSHCTVHEVERLAELKLEK